jgi:hypothetical protein
LPSSRASVIAITCIRHVEYAVWDLLTPATPAGVHVDLDRVRCIWYPSNDCRSVKVAGPYHALFVWPVLRTSVGKNNIQCVGGLTKHTIFTRLSARIPAFQCNMFCSRGGGVRFPGRELLIFANVCDFLDHMKIFGVNQIPLCPSAFRLEPLGPGTTHP